MKIIDNRKIQEKGTAEAGAAIYNHPVLSVYDQYVLGFSNSYVWQCPTSQILEFYNEHISSQHLDIGVGTGYFLDRCKFPTNTPRLALADLNPNSLQVAAKRLQRYQPMTYLANVLEPQRIEPSGFDSIALNNLLHCLPGKMVEKGIVFRNIKPLLSANGKVFGVTVLGKGIRPNGLAKFHLRVYNSKGIFGNRDDSQEDLERILKENFSDYEIRQVGCVAMFIGRG